MKFNLKIYLRFAVCLAVFLLFAVCFVPVCFAISVDEARVAIDQAEHALGVAYCVVTEADGAGADVSGLLMKLNSAGDFLSRANVAFRAGDYDSANALVAQFKGALEGVAGDAAFSKANAEKTRSDSLFFAVVVSGVGLGLLVVFGFLGWRFLKRRYYRLVLDMKPVAEAVQ